MWMRDAIASHLFIYIPSTIGPNKGSIRDYTSARNKPLWDLRSTSVRSRLSLTWTYTTAAALVVAVLRYERDQQLLPWDGITFWIFVTCTSTLHACSQIISSSTPKAGPCRAWVAHFKVIRVLANRGALEGCQIDQIFSHLESTLMMRQERRSSRPSALGQFRGPSFRLGWRSTLRGPKVQHWDLSASYACGGTLASEIPVTPRKLK